MTGPALNHPASPRTGAARPHLFFFFIDGVGVANPGAAANPLDEFDLTATNNLLGQRIFHPGNGIRSTAGVTVRTIDATLGVDGLPQSGTGQTAILTGENAPALLGRHFGPYPHSTLRPLLEEKNIFRHLSSRGFSCAYINAFPRQYFTYLERHPNLTGAFPTAWRMAGNRLNGVAELTAGRALSADCTSEGWERMGYPGVPVITPEEASEVAVSALDETDFVLYEYYFTDHAGHGRAGARIESILPMLDRFIAALAEKVVAGGHTLVITSDHGNLEDLSIKTHTRNPVPFISAGKGHRELVNNVTDLTGIRGAVSDHLTQRSGPGR